MSASATSLIRKRVGPSQETPESKKVRQEGSAVRKVIPKQFFGNHIIWKEEGRDWKYDVAAVIVEEEVKKENKTYSVLHQAVDEVLLRPLGAQELSLDQSPIPTTRMDSFGKYAAQVMVEHAGRLFPCGGHVQVKQRTREAMGTNEADSDDEQIEDPPIPAAFTAEKLCAVDNDYQKLRVAFESALCCHFGKFFPSQWGISSYNYRRLLNIPRMSAPIHMAYINLGQQGLRIPLRQNTPEHLCVLCTLGRQWRELLTVLCTTTTQVCTQSLAR